ncbi:MAG: hypothetical protein PVF15_09430 [Candidatus Bathyarchaeota archaeon]|jgi:hypothetical protein
MKMAELQRIGVLMGTLFRSLIRSGAFQWKACSLEEVATVNISGNSPYNHQKIEAAWLESEQKKAEIVEWSRRVFVS